MVAPAATSKIVSQAFRFMEVTPPSSLADASEEANAANEQYEPALRMCLEQEDFSFARRLTVMPEANLPAGEFADPDLPHLFVLPADLVKLRRVYDHTLSWRLDSQFLRSAEPGPLTIGYTWLITDETRLPATFQTAVSYQLANLLAPRFVGSRTKRADLMSDGSSALQAAIRNDNVSASHARWDGQADNGDWASEATR